MSKKILYLTLSKKPFDVMVTGEKQIEFRTPSNWILSRLIDKNYDLIKFVNGYGNDKPYFIAEYLGYDNSYTDKTHQYSNGLVVNEKKGGVRIFIGDIIECGNINKP